MTERSAVSVAGIRLPRHARSLSLDIEIEGRRIFSSAPNQGDRAHNVELLEWPDALLPYLHGSGRVTVVARSASSAPDPAHDLDRPSRSDDSAPRARRIIADEECVFDSSPGRVRVEDHSGRALAVDKYGRMHRTFDTGTPTVTSVLLDDVETALDVLAAGGAAAFLTAGALLGAVRDGRLIGHDSDVDLGYVSAAATPAGVAVESFRLERLFAKRLIDTRRFSAAEFKLLLPGPTGTNGIDIRAAFVVGDRAYVAPNVELAPEAGSLLPLSEVELEGRSFPAPADPAALLAAMYGPGWKVPDPSFAFVTPERLSRRFDGWLRGAAEDRSAWQRWHLARMSAPVRKPSDFARWVAQREPALAPGVDLGCGEGGDAVWLARSGRWVLGLDYAPNALARARAAARKAEVTSAQFDECTFGDLREVLTRGARLARARTPRSIYARRLVDGLSPATRANVWLLASMALRRGGRLYVELGTATKDDLPPMVRRRARRVALTPAVVVAEITAHGGRIQEQETVDAPGRLGGSDRAASEPRGTRLVATWQR